MLYLIRMKLLDKIVQKLFIYSKFLCRNMYILLIEDTRITNCGIREDQRSRKHEMNILFSVYPDSYGSGISLIVAQLPRIICRGIISFLVFFCWLLMRVTFRIVTNTVRAISLCHIWIMTSKLHLKYRTIVFILRICTCTNAK